MRLVWVLPSFLVVFFLILFLSLPSSFLHPTTENGCQKRARKRIKKRKKKKKKKKEEKKIQKNKKPLSRKPNYLCSLFLDNLPPSPSPPLPSPTPPFHALSLFPLFHVMEKKEILHFLHLSLSCGRLLVFFGDLVVVVGVVVVVLLVVVEMVVLVVVGVFSWGLDGVWLLVFSWVFPLCC